MKRLDLQALRGVAILLVVIFHLQPDAFSLGFAGVDIFFVLSGYLMALILSKETLSKSSLAQFYSRRFKRIVPLYYIVVVLVYIGKKNTPGGLFLVTFPFLIGRRQLLQDMKWTLAFLTNIAPLFKWHGYWEQVLEVRFFTHTWSLGVEIQFYLIAPFIIFVGHKLPAKARNILLFISITISCLSQILTPEKISYFILSSRVWEFILGILCFQDLPPFDRIAKYEKLKNPEELEKDPETIQQEKAPNLYLNDFIIVFLVALTLWNPIFPGKEHVARIVSCLLVAYVIASNSPNPGHLLSNRALIYMGDISYTMYLVHWPIIVVYKYYKVGTFSVLETLFLLIAIFLVTVVIHILVEKPIITWPAVYGLMICIGCLFFVYITHNTYLAYPLSKTGQKIEGNEVDEIIRWSLVEHEKVRSQLPGDLDNITDAVTGYIDEENMLTAQDYSNGSLKVLILGNSIGYKAFPLIYELFNKKYKELRLYSRAGAVPLVVHPAIFPEYTYAAHKIVEMMKPDIIWIIYGQINENLLKSFDENRKADDKMFQEMQEQMNFYSSHAKEVVIDFPYHWSTVQVAHTIAQRFYVGNYDLSDLRMSREETEAQQFYHQQRLAALNCSNCRYNDVQQEFFDRGSDTYCFYNRQNYHAYTNDGSHMTSEMLKRIAPIYNTVIQDLLKKYETAKM